MDHLLSPWTEREICAHRERLSMRGPARGAAGWSRWIAQTANNPRAREPDEGIGNSIPQTLALTRRRRPARLVSFG